MHASKKELHQLVDQLPENIIFTVKQFIRFMLLEQKNVDFYLQHLPYDDEPLTEEEIEAIKQSEDDIKNGKVYSLKDVAKEFNFGS